MIRTEFEQHLQFFPDFFFQRLHWKNSPAIIQRSRCGSSNSAIGLRVPGAFASLKYAPTLPFTPIV
jgi:hypothetical protein